MSVIAAFTNNNVFDPKAIAAMSKAYDFGCIAIKGRPDSDKERLARLIIEVAKEGVRDPVQLCARAVNGITTPN